MALSKREILFVLKMQNQSRKAIGEFKNELTQAAGAMNSLDGTATRLGKQRGPKGITEELMKAQVEAAKTVQRLTDIETILRDLDDANIGAFDGTPYGAALKSFKEDGATRADIEAGTAEEIAVMMERRRRAIEQLGPAYDAMGNAAERAGDKVESGLRDGNRALDQHNRQVDGATKAWRLAKLAIAGVAAFLGGSKIIREADAWKSLTGQLRLVTEGEENLKAVREELIAVSNETFSDLQATTGLYSKLAQRADQLGRSQQEIIDLTRNFSKAMQIGGASSEEAAAATRQFTQAVSAGTLRGDELNSIIENGSGLAMAFEDGLRAMGNEVTSLKAYIQEANPTIRELLQALDTQTGAIQEKFEKLPTTVRQGLTVFSNSFTEFIGKVDEASNATGGLSTFFIRLGNILRDPVFIEAVAGLANLIGGALNVALTAIIGVLNFFRENTIASAIAVGMLTTYLTVLAATRAPVAIAQITTAIKAATAATIKWTLALLANPLGALVAVIAGTVAALYMLRDAIKLPGDEAYTMGEVVKGAFIDLKLTWIDFTKAMSQGWDSFADGVEERFGMVVGALARFFGTLVEIGKATVNTVIALFRAAYHLIVGVWEAFPALMNNYFAMVVNAAATAADLVLNSWQTPLRAIAKGLSLIGENDEAAALVGWLDNATVSVGRMAKESTGLGEAWAKASAEFDRDFVGEIHSGILTQFEMWGAMGRDAAAANGEVSTSSKDLEAAMEDLSDAEKEAAANRAKAMKTLKERIEDMKVATEQQERMNMAIRNGPAAVRALNAQLAYETELREALLALKEADVDVSEGSAGRALAEAAALAAKNQELAKQAEELANLSFALDQTVEKMREQQMVAERGLAIAFEQDVSRQRELVWADTFQSKLAELTAGFRDAGYTANEYAEEMRKANAAAREFADSQRALQNASLALGLMESVKTDAQRASENFINAKMAVEEFLRSAEGLALPARDIERIREGLERLRPPENIFDSLKMGLRDYMDEIRPSFEQVRDLGRNAFNGIGDALTDLVLTGKANFGDLARSIIADLTRMIVKALLFKAISSAFGLGGGLFGGGGFSNLTLVGANGPGLLDTFSMHTGGIAGTAGATRQMYPGAFENAKKFHSGGLAGQRSLPGEVPIIAKEGEAILPTVRLPDGNFGVKADMGGGRGGSVYAPQYQLNFNGSGNGGRTPADLDPEMQKKFGAMLQEELEIHTQRKFEEWTRPGGQLHMAMRRR